MPAPRLERLVIVAALLAGNSLAGTTEPLPRPEALAGAVDFWKRVYSEVGTNGGFVHDSRYLDVVYEVVVFPTGTGPRAERKILDATTARYRTMLEALSSGAVPGDAETARVAELWRARGAEARIGAADRLRFQRGQADRFRSGLSRASRWHEYITGTLRNAGVPEALAALPHVESSFDPTARSHADALGLWQFTASTGRRYMQVDHVVDERLDPYLSTRAAAQLLRHNYEVTDSWPLAITAYNHGAAGVRRAAEQLGTRDIGKIVWHYRGPSFGFASRNFYAAFLAALEVEAEAETLFGPVPRAAAEQLREATLDDYLSVTSLAAAMGVEVDLLRAHNPALQAPVWNGEKRWPRGFPLRLPDGHGPADLNLALTAIPGHLRYAEQVPDKYHHVARGEALSGIAARYGTTVRELVALNRLRDPHRIRSGTRLMLPGAVDDLPAAMPAVFVTTSGAETAAAVEVSGRVVTEPSLPAPDPDLIGMPRELGADPSDFEVAADGTIEIQPFETLGHYADWLQIPAGRLRKDNGLHQGSSLVVGRRLQLDLSRVDAAAFEASRREYHRLAQETFFARFHITGTLEHRVRAGDSLWGLSRRYTNVPMWLMRQYNPDLDFGTLRPGTAVLVPVLAQTELEQTELEQTELEQNGLEHSAADEASSVSGCVC